MTTIKPRQLYFFLACIAPLGKVILMPSTLVYYSGNDLLFPALCNLVVQAAVIFFVLLLAKKGLSLYELLRNSFGHIAAKIIICIFCCFLFYASVVPFNEQKLMTQSLFYDTLPSLLVFLPFFAFSAYLCAKPVRSLGRVWDILAVVSIVSFAVIFVFALEKADLGAVNPVGAYGWGGFLKGTAYTISWYFDSALVLSLLGRIKPQKGLAVKGLVSYLAGAAALIFFLALFQGVFQNTAVSQLYAFTKISKYFSGVAVLGRIDYIFLYAVAIAMAFYCAMPLQASVDLVSEAFGRGKVLSALLSIALNLAMLALVVGFNYRTESVQLVINKTLFWIFPVFTVAVPLLSLALRRQKVR